MQQGHPTDLSALNNLAWLYQRQGEFTKARELAERALAISPSDARVTNTLGLILLNQGEAARAVAYLTAAGSRLPGAQTSNITSRSRSNERAERHCNDLADDPGFAQSQRLLDGDLVERVHRHLD